MRGNKREGKQPVKVVRAEDQIGDSPSLERRFNMLSGERNKGECHTDAPFPPFLAAFPSPAREGEIRNGFRGNVLWDAIPLFHRGKGSSGWERGVRETVERRGGGRGAVLHDEDGGGRQTTSGRVEEGLQCRTYWGSEAVGVTFPVYISLVSKGRHAGPFVKITLL